MLRDLTILRSSPISLATRAAVVAVAAFLLASPTAAQQASKRMDTPRLSQAAKDGWFLANIVEGRIVVLGRRFGSSVTKSHGTGPNEQLNIRADGNKPAIVYKMSGPEGEFSFDVQRGTQVKIHQLPKEGSGLAGLEFQQKGDEPISLIVEHEGTETVYTAETLWHLMIAEPEVCREQLVPLLGALVGNRDLTASARQIEKALISAGAAGGRPERERWAGLVEQLGDDRFARREEADRALRQAGPLVVTFLGQLDRSELDAEQDYRVRRIIRALSDQSGEDTPELAAARLAGDPIVWLALLDREEESTRRLAADQLAALLGKAIAFDATADAATRAAQIEQLRRQVTPP